MVVGACVLVGWGAGSVAGIDVGVDVGVGEGEIIDRLTSGRSIDLVEKNRLLLACSSSSENEDPE